MTEWAVHRTTPRITRPNFIAVFTHRLSKVHVNSLLCCFCHEFFRVEKRHVTLQSMFCKPQTSKVDICTKRVHIQCFSADLHIWRWRRWCQGCRTTSTLLFDFCCFPLWIVKLKHIYHAETAYVRLCVHVSLDWPSCVWVGVSVFKACINPPLTSEFYSSHTRQSDGAFPAFFFFFLMTGVRLTEQRNNFPHTISSYHFIYFKPMFCS